MVSRRIALAVGLAAVCCVSAVAQEVLWAPDGKCPTGNRSYISDMCFQIRDGVAVLQNGQVWITRDRGETWSVVDLREALGVSEAYLTSCAMDGDQIMVAGTAVAADVVSRILAYSTDGGATWTLSAVEGLAGVSYWHVAAIDIEPRTTKALAVGLYFPPGEERNLESRGYHLSRPLILYTEDGGATWRRTAEPEVRAEDCIDLTGARLRSEGVSWICGRGGTLCAGQPPFDSWSNAPFPESESAPRLTSLYSIKDEFVVSRADGKVMMHDGDSWNITTVSPGAYIQDVAFLTNRDGVAIGYTSVFHTSDGGATWVQDYLAPGLFLFEFDCLRAVDVFARPSQDVAHLFSFCVGAQHQGTSGMVEPCILRPKPMLQLSPQLLRGIRFHRLLPLQPDVR